MDREHGPGIRQRAGIPADGRGGKPAGPAGRSERGTGGSGRPRRGPRGRRQQASPSCPAVRVPGYWAVARRRRERRSGRARRSGPAGPPAPREARPPSPGEGRSSRTSRCNRRTGRIASDRQGGRWERPRRPPLRPNGRNRQRTPPLATAHGRAIVSKGSYRSVPRGRHSWQAGLGTCRDTPGSYHRRTSPRRQGGGSNRGLGYKLMPAGWLIRRRQASRGEERRDLVLALRPGRANGDGRANGNAASLKIPPRPTRQR
jgi:hypothetical protein